MTNHPLRCLACCERIVRVRGLCDRCYQRALLAVLAGETTWELLIEQRRALPKKKRPWEKGFAKVERQ